MFIVPIFQDQSSKFKIEVELNNEIFRLKFQWNTRAEDWYMSILDNDDNEIITNIKMVINYKLLEQYSACENCPKGDFILWDLEKTPETGGITFNNLGRRYQLLFYTNEEIEAAS